jgi:hypothetical protein
VGEIDPHDSNRKDSAMGEERRGNRVFGFDWSDRIPLESADGILSDDGEFPRRMWLDPPRNELGPHSAHQSTQTPEPLAQESARNKCQLGSGDVTTKQMQSEIPPVAVEKRTRSQSGKKGPVKKKRVAGKSGKGNRLPQI